MPAKRRVTPCEGVRAGTTTHDNDVLDALNDEQLDETTTEPYATAVTFLNAHLAYSQSRALRNTSIKKLEPQLGRRGLRN